jgi:hypothetical protein
MTSMLANVHCPENRNDYFEGMSKETELESMQIFAFITEPQMDNRKQL